MLEFKNINVKMKKTARPLIENFNFVLNKGNKVAIIGEEGNGKSTFLKFIYNASLIDDYCVYTGQILKKDLSIGYLEQSLSDEWNEIHTYEFFLKDIPADDVDFEMYNKLAEISYILSKLKTNPKLIESEQKIGLLSGGEKIKLQLAKLIVKNPDIMLLDEPTNDIDIDTLKWMEEFINSTDIPLMYISHDETLLERTANIVIHLEQVKKKSVAKHTIENIGYSDYVEKRLNKIIKQEHLARSEYREYREDRKTLKQLKDTVKKANPDRQNRMRALLSQEKKLESKTLTEKPDMEDSIFFDFHDINFPNGKLVLDFSLQELSVANKQLSKNINLMVKGPEHLAIIGRNGIGKTTLFKKIYDALKDRDDLKLGYMPQSYEEVFELNDTALEFLLKNTLNVNETTVMTFMGSMKFTKDEMIQKIKNLSGGQKAKLLILKMMLTNSNVLLLDEPTRNLSPLSNPVIRKVLSDYKGAIISISHDRKYIEEVCNSVYELNIDGLKKL